MRSITSTFRIQGRTAYVTEIGNQNPSVLGSAIALGAFSISGNTLPIIEKLANYAAQEGNNGEIFWYSSEQLAHLILSLSVYDELKGNTNPNLEVTVTTENSTTKQTLIEGKFDSAKNPPIFKTFFFEDIYNSNVDFRACCVGEASIVFGAAFVPAQLYNSSVYRGIQVNKIVQLLDTFSNQPYGPPITSAQTGQQVVVTIEITIPDASPSFIIVDPFPGLLNL